MKVVLTTRKRNPRLMLSCATEMCPLLRICTHQEDHRLEFFLLNRSASLFPKEGEGQEEIKKKMLN